MNRGQAAAVLCRMYDVFSGTGTTTPATPDESDTPTSTELGQKLSSGATAAAGVASGIGKRMIIPLMETLILYPTMGITPELPMWMLERPDCSIAHWSM